MLLPLLALLAEGGYRMATGSSHDSGDVPTSMRAIAARVAEPIGAHTPGRPAAEGQPTARLHSCPFAWGLPHSRRRLTEVALPELITPEAPKLLA